MFLAWRRIEFLLKCLLADLSAAGISNADEALLTGVPDTEALIHRCRELTNGDDVSNDEKPLINNWLDTVDQARRGAAPFLRSHSAFVRTDQQTWAPAFMTVEVQDGQLRTDGEAVSIEQLRIWHSTAAACEGSWGTLPPRFRRSPR
ncbi:hypothetical protein Acy02nite_88570 [Actinoplanes cyaneus]|uniref:Uncharacterized protein n=2 Tax=Actinoplanes cyaneus TaxID=52696 RepID=A0A919ITY4_9ACTN|nr:hypothetical protein [Actinoplanes cyaneus]GID70976.1 hypothetical protein Acy02nite_88570 [Actinoplanes cyaneus]